MSRRLKNTRKIVVNETEYRWIVIDQDDGCNIGISIWPASNTGPSISTKLSFNVTRINNYDRDGKCISTTTGNDQIIITGKVIRKLILHCVADLNYNIAIKGKSIALDGRSILDLNSILKAPL